MGSYTFSGEKIDDFAMIFQDPTLIYMNLPPTKQNVCVESYVLGINTFTCRKARQCKGSLKTRANQTFTVISGSMDMCESNERAMGKTRVFSHIL